MRFAIKNWQELYFSFCIAFFFQLLWYYLNYACRYLYKYQLCAWITLGRNFLGWSDCHSWITASDLCAGVDCVLMIFVLCITGLVFCSGAESWPLIRAVFVCCVDFVLMIFVLCITGLVFCSGAESWPLIRAVFVCWCWLCADDFCALCYRVVLNHGLWSELYLCAGVDFVLMIFVLCVTGLVFSSGAESWPLIRTVSV